MITLHKTHWKMFMILHYKTTIPSLFNISHTLTIIYTMNIIISLTNFFRKFSKKSVCFSYIFSIFITFKFIKFSKVRIFFKLNITIFFFKLTINISLSIKFFFYFSFYFFLFLYIFSTLFRTTMLPNKISS